MGLIVKTRFKIPSGLKEVQRDYPIGDHTVNRSTTNIKGSNTGVHKGVILRRRLIDLLLL